MYKSEQIKEIIDRKIKQDEKLGHQSGGSGHMAHVSYRIDDFSFEAVSETEIKIDYEYTIFVETEFTYYPDNPPYESFHQRCILYNSSSDTITEIPDSPLPIVEEADNDDWESVQKEIDNYVVDILARIEWNYGEGRAPFVYPPQFMELLTENLRIEYRCLIELEDSDGHTLLFKSEDPAEVLELLKKDFDERYSWIR